MKQEARRREELLEGPFSRMEEEARRRQELFEGPFSRMQEEERRRQELFEGPFSRMQEEARRRQELLEGPFSRMQRELQGRQDLVDRLAGRTASVAIQTVDSVLGRALSLPDLDVFRSRTPVFSEIDRTLRMQTEWMRSLQANLESTSFRTLAMGFSGSIDFAKLIPEFETALGSAALEFPDTFDALQGQFPEVAHELAEGVVRAAEGDPELTNRSVTDFIDDILSHYGLLDEKGRAKLILAIAVLLISIAGGAIGESLGGEWNRFRDASSQEEAQATQVAQTEELERIRSEMIQLHELVAHPPRPARVVRRAWLRASPNTQAEKLGPILEVGTSLVVYERTDRWVRVEAEPTPGDVRAGWVYGPLTRYE
ncbi:MAG TPA: hypothetical protein VF092_30790 [Longimicrobium sp.]